MTAMLNEALATVLQQLRTENNLSQEDLGLLADLHRTYISQLERGLKSPSLQTLAKICAALNIKMSQLLAQVETQIEQNHVSTDF